jgi:hypothetical protein
MAVTFANTKIVDQAYSSLHVASRRDPPKATAVPPLAAPQPDSYLLTTFTSPEDAPTLTTADTAVETQPSAIQNEQAIGSNATKSASPRVESELEHEPEEDSLAMDRGAAVDINSESINGPDRTPQRAARKRKRKSYEQPKTTIGIVLKSRKYSRKTVDHVDKPVAAPAKSIQPSSSEEHDQVSPPSLIEVSIFVQGQWVANASLSLTVLSHIKIKSRPTSSQPDPN